MKIGELLENLSLPEYRHVAVRRETSASEEYLGGSGPSGVARRFGNRDIRRCDIRENLLIIYIKNEN